MTEDEYTKRKSDLQEEFLKRKYQLDIKFASENNKFKIGDIVTDNIGSGRIEKIKLCTGVARFPSCLYECENLTKKGTVNKLKPKRAIYQINLINEPKKV